MFKNAITQTPLTTTAANEFFQNVTGEAYNGDVSLLATLRALIAPRMQPDDRLHLSFRTSSYSAENITAMSASYEVNAICQQHRLSRSGQIFVHSFSATKQDSNLACMALIKRSFCEENPGWQRFEDITNVAKNVANVLCFINPAQKSVILFVERLNMQKLHFLQAAILGLFPWYHELGTEVSEQEIELLQSFLERSSDRYLACLEAVKNACDFEAMRLRRELTGFETRQMRSQLDSVQRALDQKRNDLNAYNNRIADLLSEIDRRSTEQMGLEARISRMADSSELLDYFLCNRNVVLEHVTEDKLFFHVRGYLSYFDEEVVRRCLENRNSFVYYYLDDDVSPAQMKKLIQAVFLDEKIKLRFCAAYSLGMACGINPRSYQDFGADADSYMPNPHINRYGCMGAYSRAISELILRRDYVGAIEQCVASAKSLNWCDSTVMKEFFRMIIGHADAHDTHNCAFELPDGSVVRYREAIRWLEQQEQEHENNETEAAHE